MWSRKLDRKQTKIIIHVVEVAGALFLATLAPTLNVIFQSIDLDDSLQLSVFHPEKLAFTLLVYHCALY